MSSAKVAIHFEALKVAMRQTKDGYAMTFLLHPNDVPPELFASPVGQRYMVAVVELDDNERPAVKAALDGAVQYAAVLCREPLFWRFIFQYDPHWDTPVRSEEDAALWLRSYLDLDSRAELSHNKEAKEQFNEMVREYKAWAGM